MQPLAFVDLETTGATASQGRITEIGIILVNENGVEEWSSLVSRVYKMVEACGRS